MSTNDHAPLPFRGHPVAATAIDLRLDGIPGITLPLYRLPRTHPAPNGPVLLLHGASAWSHSFTVGTRDGLGGYLLENGFDVFLLDWRGSMNMVAKYGPNAAAYDVTSLDSCAEHDVSRAIEAIREIRREDRRPIAIFAHCVGGGVAAMAIAAGHVVARGEPADLPDRVDRVVLSTLGLFYEVAWDGVLKGEDHLLEKVRVRDPKVYAVDSSPDVPFPKDIDDVYTLWPAAARPDDPLPRFQKLSFMFGMPYLAPSIVDGLHSEAGLSKQFGMMHLQLFQHGVQNLRRGFAAPLDADESVSDLAGSSSRRRMVQRRPMGARVRSTPQPLSVDHYLDLSAWSKLDRVHLLTGEQNTLWHRTSIDSMYEFLRRRLSAAVCTKQIHRGYGHQDLLWGKRSADDVFPSILTALTDRLGRRSS